MNTRNLVADSAPNSSIFREAMNELQAAVAIYDGEDRLAFYNRTFLNLYPAFAEIADNRPTFKELADLSRRRNLVHGMQEGSSWADIRIERHGQADGQPFLQRIASGKWLRITESRLEDGSTVTIQSDVTDMVEEQRRRKNQSELLENTIEAIGEGLCVLDADGMIVMRNQRACELLRMSEQTLVPGAQIDRLLAQHVGDRQHMRLLFEVFCSDRPDGVVKNFETDENTTLELRSYSLDSGGGVCIVKDVSERNRVQEMNRVLAAFPRENPNPVLSTRPDGQITYANFAVENLILELKLDNAAEILPETHKEIVGTCVRTGEVQHGMVSQKCDRVFEWTYRPQRHGNLVHIYGSDITERLNAEKERKELEGALHHAQRLEALGSMAGGIAHEFNNMLMPMLGLAELTLKRMEDDTVESRNLQRILTAGQRAKKLVAEILSFGRVEDMELELLSLTEALQETVHLIRSTMPSTIEFEFRSHIGEAQLEADSGRIQQVLVNLCANAVQAIGGHVGRIDIIVDIIESDENFIRQHPVVDQSARHFVKITVIDTGEGIDEDAIDRIFEPFFTTKEVGEGTGLGLSVVHGIVLKLGGEIAVYSRPGAGTRFDVFLPAKNYSDKATPALATALDSINDGNGTH